MSYLSLKHKNSNVPSVKTPVVDKLNGLEQWMIFAGWDQCFESLYKNWGDWLCKVLLENIHWNDDGNSDVWLLEVYLGCTVSVNWSGCQCLWYCVQVTCILLMCSLQLLRVSSLSWQVVSLLTGLWTLCRLQLLRGSWRWLKKSLQVMEQSSLLQRPLQSSLEMTSHGRC